MTEFEFQTREGESLTLKEAVFQALGAASTCWEPMDCTGEFQSQRAGDIGNKLLEFIEEFIKDLQDKDRSNALQLVRSKVPAALEVLGRVADNTPSSEQRIKACDIILKYGLGY
jgi:hypothetical protein